MGSHRHSARHDPPRRTATLRATCESLTRYKRSRPALRSRTTHINTASTALHPRKIGTYASDHPLEIVRRQTGVRWRTLVVVPWVVLNQPASAVEATSAWCVEPHAAFDQHLDVVAGLTDCLKSRAKQTPIDESSCKSRIREGLERWSSPASK